ncbi:amidohydrolase family protein [Lachnospiraceae bacterium ZAX-1]
MKKMKKMKKAFALLLTIVLAVSGILPSIPASAAKADTADTIYTNGNIYTADATFSTATTLAVKGDKLLYVGNENGAEKYKADSTQIVDLEGKTVLPGLIDSHLHYLRIGTKQEQIDIFWKPKAEILAAVKAEAERLGPGEWVLATGWLDTAPAWGVASDFPNTPTKAELDAVAPLNPVALTRADNHSLWCNSLALKKANIDKNTPNPDGGDIIKGLDGEPTGILRETAMPLVNNVAAIVSAERTTARYILADKHLISYGITSLADMAITYADSNILTKAYQDGKLNVRAYEMLAYVTNEDKKYIDAGKKPTKDVLGDGKLAFNGVKIVADGSLGSRSASMIEEYSDDHTTGIPRMTDAQMNAAVKRAKDEGFQVATHAIGDAAVRQAINAYVAAVGGNESKVKDNRFRIEHFQIVAAEDIPKATKLGIIASMQTVHATSDMTVAETRVGSERIKSSYAWRTVLNNGGIIANGTDAPVELVNPYYNLYAAVTRQDQQGQPPSGWYGEQKLTRQEALKSYTIWGAYAQFAENIKGSLEAGKYADFVVIDRDYMTCPEIQIKDITALATVIGGEVVYTAPAYTKVTGISNVPKTATVGTTLTLPKTATPFYATNNAITWKVKNAGTTKAKISGNKLTTKAVGTVVVTATVTNGKTATTNYTKDFSITVNLADAIVKKTSQTTTSIKLEWSKVTGAKGYVIKRASSKNGSYKTLTTISKAATIKYTDSKLKSGTIYYYQIIPYSVVNGKNTLLKKPAIIKLATKPGTPKPEVKAGNNSVTIKWEKVRGASGYEISRSTSKDGKYTVVKKGNILKFTNKNLKANKAYYYKVRAFKEVDKKTIYSSWSAPQTVKTKKVTPTT